MTRPSPACLHACLSAWPARLISLLLPAPPPESSCHSLSATTQRSGDSNRTLLHFPNTLSINTLHTLTLLVCHCLALVLAPCLRFRGSTDPLTQPLPPTLPRADCCSPPPPPASTTRERQTSRKTTNQRCPPTTLLETSPTRPSPPPPSPQVTPSTLRAPQRRPSATPLAPTLGRRLVKASSRTLPMPSRRLPTRRRMLVRLERLPTKVSARADGNAHCWIRLSGGTDSIGHLLHSGLPFNSLPTDWRWRRLQVRVMRCQTVWQSYKVDAIL